MLHKACVLWFTILFPLQAAGPRSCRQTRDPSVSASWEFDGRGAWSASTANRTVGALSLTCHWTLPTEAQSIAVKLENVLVSFISSLAKTNGSGLLIDVVEPRSTRHSTSYLRITGEDWIESSNRAWIVDLSRPTRRITLELKLIDNAPDAAVRVDLRGLTISAAPGPRP